MEELLRHPLVIDPPMMNAAGSLGFAPNFRLPLQWEKFGAFVTNPVSLKPRKPASGPRWRTFSGGGVLHSGHPNPGIRSVIRQYAPQWAASRLPVIVHLLADYPDEISRRIKQLETLENIQAVELGFPDDITETEVKEMISAAVGEKPVIARLPFLEAKWLGPFAIQSGAVAIGLSPPRGALPDGQDIHSGRILGPGQFPVALEAVRQLAQADLQVIVAGGVYTQEQAAVMVAAGALAVQIDLAIWRGDWFNLVEEENGGDHS